MLAPVASDWLWESPHHLGGQEAVWDEGSSSELSMQGLNHPSGCNFYLHHKYYYNANKMLHEDTIALFLGLSWLWCLWYMHAKIKEGGRGSGSLVSRPRPAFCHLLQVTESREGPGYKARVLGFRNTDGSHGKKHQTFSLHFSTLPNSKAPPWTKCPQGSKEFFAPNKVP